MNYFDHERRRLVDRARREIQRERLDHERMAIKAGIIFLIGYIGAALVVMIPAIVNEAPQRHPDMWRYLHQTARLP